ncbi:MAG: hypothetical protein KF847_18210 [Pirellulales bacterium]|nr:hypothetical protein [Pirellulales bacterium]
MSLLPEIYQADLDGPTLEALVADVAALGGDVEVIPRRRPHELISGAELSLAEALHALQSGAMSGIQLRYDHQGRHWCDTIAPTKSGWRLVRIDLGEAASCGGEPS